MTAAETILNAHGLKDWIAAKESDLKIDSVPKMEFEFKGGPSVHVPVGTVKRCVLELQSVGDQPAADKLRGVLPTNYRDF
jgi:hypothetical protein